MSSIRKRHLVDAQAYPPYEKRRRIRLASSLQLETASNILDKALALGRAESMLPLTVVVLDSGGRVVAMKNEDGSGIMRHEIAIGKAWGAQLFGECTGSPNEMLIIINREKTSTTSTKNH